MINLKDFQWRHFSQYGEDGIIQKIFEVIPPRWKTFVEIGAHFHEANALKLMQHEKWRGFFFDDFHEFPPLGFFKAWVTKENINDLFNKCLAAGIQKDLDIISVDIDGMDWYLIKELDTSWTPSIFIVECNPQLGPIDSLVVEYDPKFRWDGSIYTGASIKAWEKLMSERGYTLIHIESHGINAFFLRNDLPYNEFEGAGNIEHFWQQLTIENNYLPSDKKFITV